MSAPVNGRLPVVPVPGEDVLGVDELGSPWTPWNPTFLLHPEPASALLHADYPPNTGDEFHMIKYIQRFFFESQVSVSILSNANGAVINDPLTGTRPARNIAENLANEILTGSQTGAIRDWVNQIAGSPRMLAHGQFYPGVGNLNDPVFGDYMQMKTLGNCFYGSFTGNGAPFGRPFANNDPIFFKTCR